MVKEESGAIANDIMDIQIQINMKNQGCFNFKNQMSKEMILENEYSNLFDKILLIYFVKEMLIDIFGDQLICLLKKILEQSIKF